MAIFDFLKKKELDPTSVNQFEMKSNRKYRYCATFSSVDFIKIDSDYPDDYVVLDFETTGLKHYDSRIVEIGCVRVRNKQVTNIYETYINPEILIPPEAFRVHNISNKMVKSSPKIYEVIDDLIAFIGTDVIVAHNAPFDLSFLVSAILGMYDYYKFDYKFVDTLTLSQEMFPKLRSYTLDSLKSEFKITGDSHRAASDCYATHQIFELCKNKYITQVELDTLSRSQLMGSLDSIEKEFYDFILDQMKVHKIDKELSINRLGNGTLNFKIDDVQIGRVKFKGKKTIQTITRSDVMWVNIETLEEAKTISKMWFLYYKSV
jgi:DNA polymerase-3 subunit epsilon